MTHIAVYNGHNPKQRLLLDHGYNINEETLFSVCNAHKMTHRGVFLEFEDGLYYPLNDDYSTSMACVMVAMSHRRIHDEDGWIEEAHAMEAATQDHMLESSSEDEEHQNDDDYYTDSVPI